MKLEKKSKKVLTLEINSSKMNSKKGGRVNDVFVKRATC